GGEGVPGRPQQGPGAARTTPPAPPPTGSRRGTPNAPHARPARSAGGGNRSGAASPPAGTGSARASTARSFTGGEYATVAAATRRRGHPSALGDGTHNGSPAAPSVGTATCAQGSTRLARVTTAVPVRSGASLEGW